jgi:hypothetical protein
MAKIVCGADSVCNKLGPHASNKVLSVSLKLSKVLVGMDQEWDFLNHFLYILKLPVADTTIELGIRVHGTSYKARPMINRLLPACTLLLQLIYIDFLPPQPPHKKLEKKENKKRGTNQVTLPFLLFHCLVGLIHAIHSSYLTYYLPSSTLTWSHGGISWTMVTMNTDSVEPTFQTPDNCTLQCNITWY